MGQDNKIVEIIKFGLQHSIALAFLIFSGIFIIFSIKFEVEKYILIAFFTFFYALLAYRIRVISKKEVWGDYAVGDNFGALLYFLTEWLFFIGWIVGSVLLLNDVQLFDLFSDHGFFTIILTFASATFVAWAVLIYWRKICHESSDFNQKAPLCAGLRKRVYRLSCYCARVLIRKQKNNFASYFLGKNLL